MPLILRPNISAKPLQEQLRVFDQQLTCMVTFCIEDLHFLMIDLSASSKILFALLQALTISLRLSYVLPTASFSRIVPNISNSPARRTIKKGFLVTRGQRHLRCILIPCEGKCHVHHRGTALTTMKLILKLVQLLTFNPDSPVYIERQHLNTSREKNTWTVVWGCKPF